MCAPVVLALLAGIGCGDVLLPLLGRMSRLRLSPLAGEPPGAGAVDGKALAFSRRVLLGALLVYAVISAAWLPATDLAALPASERAAMAWVAQRTPPNDGVLVLGADARTQADLWSTAADRTAGWFPVLAQRTSVATYEGSEWTGQFFQRSAVWQAVQFCADRGDSCLDDWACRYGQPFNDIFIPKGSGADAPDGQLCCAALRTSLAVDPRYRTIYDGPGATVYARRS